MLAVQSSRPLVPFANPGYGYGRAILGSMGGNLGGGLLGSLVASVVAPPPGPAPSGVQGEVGVDEATQAQAERADKAWAYLPAAFATLGAAAGAAAAPLRRGRPRGCGLARAPRRRQHWRPRHASGRDGPRHGAAGDRGGHRCGSTSTLRPGRGLARMSEPGGLTPTGCCAGARPRALACTRPRLGGSADGLGSPAPRRLASTRGAAPPP